VRSRWYHKPVLHTPALGIEKKATWLELFYDLIFVAAFIQLGNGLSVNVTPKGVLIFVGVFIPLWVAWSGFTFFENRYSIDDFTHRLMVFAQMFAVGGMAISAPEVLVGKTAAFSICTGVAFGAVAAMQARAFAQLKEARAYAAYWGIVFGVSALGWFISAALEPGYAMIVWIASTAGLLAAPLSRQSRELSERFPLDFEHLAERYGLLTIIVLGESFVKVLGSLTAEEAGLALYLEGGVTLLLTCAIWWIYFDDIAGSHIRKGPFKWIIWLFAHIPIQASVTITGVAIKKAVGFSWDEPAPDGYRWLLAGAVAATLFSVSIVDSVTERRQAELSDRARVNARWISAVLLLILAPAGRTMSGGMFLTMVTVVLVAQVVFDMMMAPLEASEHAELGAKSTTELSEEASEGGKAVRLQRDVSEAVRKGAPPELRRDLYFYFIEGSWTRVFVALVFVFLAANVFFAGLYTLEPGCIANAKTDSFAEAFFFSVQTMSTIGYGTLTPATPYGNAVVTAEAALSIIGVAIVTGLVFAKVSRAKASVLFSDSMVLTAMHGKPTLMFRVGNARGNEVVDATVNVTVLIDGTSPEGHHIRRLHDLELSRSRSPLFTLSWAVMHEIDDASPLAKVDWEEPEQHIMAFVVTLVGHDGTYGQTIYSRKNYYAADIRHNHKFADVMSELPDGRLMIDYSVFHDTVPLEEA